MRYPDEPIPLRGFGKRVIETRQADVLIARGRAAGRSGHWRGHDHPGRAAEVRPPRAPRRRRDGRGVISLQNLDRDGRLLATPTCELLTTLAASLSVALENVRLIDETRQRLAELATVNEVGNALATQLDLGNLLDLVGEQIRRTFEADLVYVALLDSSSERIEFPYYYEGGTRSTSRRSRSARA